MPNNSKKKDRDMYDILAAILRICEQTTKRTHLIYKANLSHGMLLSYLETALRAGLLNEEADRSLLITVKGRLFLQEYAVIERLLGDGVENGNGLVLAERLSEPISQ